MSCFANHDQHHHRTNLYEYHPDYFVQVCMRLLHHSKKPGWKPTIHVDGVRSEGCFCRGQTQFPINQVAASSR
ncbi:uncharacterized protein BCR38DRAFT_429853 [Pseudomassariella vexata]|uniref:Uncharacterized protein n=1 Tax=Pseudomassariella vexata TaxID=1141098 RepID=A0A1Y2E4E3_9PEZI|nr:uncharacterized protein BCR38DRAFT_429853 [Pseudomassariella vexata]ORY66307.1 hypothetical protein BCR38DRAFT_429853 [Pseudomassariella vexata]